MAIFYVSTEGNDDCDGLQPSPHGGHTGCRDRARSTGPFRTVERARNAIRDARESGDSGPFAVEIRGGWYFLDKPLRLEPHDSGSERSPVVYRAYRDETPVLSGGVPLGGFSTTTIHDRPGWVTDVPSSLRFTQLFVNGTRMNRPRLPQSGHYRIADCSQKTLPHDWGSRIESFVYSNSDLSHHWHNLSDVEVIVTKLWFESHTKVTSINPTTRTVTLDTPLIGGASDGETTFASYWVENVFEAMTEPGQFYLDSEESRLFYLPRFGDRLETAKVVAPRLETLLEFAGDPFGQSVHHIHFENIEFRHTEYAYEVGYPGAVQAAFTLPGAITFRGAAHCALYGCTVSQVAQYAVEFRLGCTGNRIVACHLHDLGGGGVKINHDRGCETPIHEDLCRPRSEERFGLAIPKSCDADDLPPQNVTVTDCTIHDIGKIFISSVGIWIGDSAANRVLHNEIFRTNYSGISCGWSWVFEFDTRCADNRIEGNHIHHLNQERLLSDLAGIYTLGASPGTVLRGNLIHDIDTSMYGNWGIYHDGSSSFHFDEYNAAFRCGYGAFFSNVGRNNIVRRNILVNDARPDNPALVVGPDGAILTLTAEENLLVSQAPQILFAPDYQGHVRFRRNIYASEFNLFGFGARPFLAHMMSPEEWANRGLGTDEVFAKHRVTVSESGEIRVPAAAEWLDAEWRTVLDGLGKVGPRIRGILPSTLAEVPVDQDNPRPVILPIVTLDTTMFGDERRELYVPKLFVSPDGTSVGTLRLVNRGRCAATGKVRFCFETSDAGTVEAPQRDFCLQPKEDITIPFSVSLAPGWDGALVVVDLEEGSGFHPVGMFLYHDSGTGRSDATYATG